MATGGTGRGVALGAMDALRRTDGWGREGALDLGGAVGALRQFGGLGREGSDGVGDCTGCTETIWWLGKGDGSVFFYLRKKKCC